METTERVVLPAVAYFLSVIYKREENKTPLNYYCTMASRVLLEAYLHLRLLLYILVQFSPSERDRLLTNVLTVYDSSSSSEHF